MAASTFDFDLNIQKLEQHQAGGCWVKAEVEDYYVEALVFAGHADNPEWELHQSRISKLWITRNGKIMFNWDRGLDVAAVNDEVQAIVDFLCSGLAGLIYQDDLV